MLTTGVPYSVAKDTEELVGRFFVIKEVIIAQAKRVQNEPLIMKCSL